jgi:predicted phage terminase large subunit-like protein
MMHSQPANGMGSRAFQCAFQGNPIPLGGNAIKTEWIQRYDNPPKDFIKVVCALDASAKCGVRNDYSAIVKIGITKNAFYVLDVWRGKVEFPGLLRRVKLLEDEHPAPAVLYAEDSSNATAMIQSLRSDSRVAIVPIIAKGSKESRIEGITGLLEAKRVFLPNEAPFLLDFERELFAWPQVAHDDQTDALALALSQSVRILRNNNWTFAILHQ